LPDQERLYGASPSCSLPKELGKGSNVTRSGVEVDGVQCTALAPSLDDTPETVISIHMLSRSLCRSLVLGAPEFPLAAMLQSVADPTEPTGFGDDAADLWRLLRCLTGWTCVNVSRDAGRPLATLIANDTGRASRLREDIYQVLAEPARPFPHPAVRRLTIDDRNHLDAAEASLGTPGWNWGSGATMLEEGIAAGGIVDDRLVAIAYTGAVSGRHADIGVATLPAWQGRGLATASAALVSEGIQATGRTPVWSAGENNLASLQVARKLGFVEVSRRVYVIPDRPAPTTEPEGGTRANS
jgi:RimJ/RimL family protein N-acetyltransferase